MENQTSLSSDDNLCLYQFIGGVLLFKTTPSKNLHKQYSIYVYIGKILIRLFDILTNYNQLYVFLYTRNHMSDSIWSIKFGVSIIL